MGSPLPTVLKQRQVTPASQQTLPKHTDGGKAAGCTWWLSGESARPDILMLGEATLTGWVGPSAGSWELPYLLVLVTEARGGSGSSGAKVGM